MRAIEELIRDLRNKINYNLNSEDIETIITAYGDYLNNETLKEEIEEIKGELDNKIKILQKRLKPTKEGLIGELNGIKKEERFANTARSAAEHALLEYIDDEDIKIAFQELREKFR